MSALEPRGHVVVIGGGITGLVAAYRLLHPTVTSHRPTRVTLVESSSNVGG
jgi:protoporphyrinogen oxidase